MKYYVYAGYYENFISGHKLPKPYTLRDEFKTFDEALDYVLENWEDDAIFFTEDVIGDAIDDGFINDEDWEDYLMKESKKSARKSIKESLNFKKDYEVEVSGGDYWLKPFYWDFDEFRDDLLIASEESGFTYYITTASTNEYRINIEFNNGPSRRYDITFRIIPKSNKETLKELNDYLN